MEWLFKSDRQAATERAGEKCTQLPSGNGEDMLRLIRSGLCEHIGKIGGVPLCIAILLAIQLPLAFAEEPKANIGFVDGASVTLSPESSGALELKTPVKNSGSEPGEPFFELRGDEEAGCITKNLTADPKAKLESNEIAITHFKITNVQLPATCYIEIQTHVGGEIVNRTMKQVKLSQTYATKDVLIALMIGLELSVLVVIATRNEVRRKLQLPPKFRLGSPAWDFAKSWLSTITLVNGIITTALALSALPELTRHASKGGYALLVLLLSFAVIVAPFAFIVFSCGSVEKVEKGYSIVYRGRLAAFFLSCAITLFAGLAQLAVVFLLLDEVLHDYEILLGLLLVIVLMGGTLCWYAGYSMFLTVKLQFADKLGLAEEQKGPLQWTVL